MSELLTNFKDDILAESMEGRRRYQMITNEDGTVSFVDVTEYEQVGSEFGQAEINVIHRAINNKLDSGEVIDPLAAEEVGFAADAKLTGDALREVSAKMEIVWNKLFPPEKYFIKSGILQFGEWTWNNTSEATGSAYQSGSAYCLSTKVTGTAGRGIAFSTSQIDTNGLETLKFSFAGITNSDYTVRIVIKNQSGTILKSENVTMAAGLTKSYDISSAESITIALTVSIAGATNILKISSILLF